MIGLATITPFGFAIIPIFLLSLFLGYRWLKSGNKNQNAGCFSVVIAGIVIFMIICFPASITFSLFEEGTKEVRIIIIAFWVILVALVTYLIISGNYKKIGSFLIKGCLYVVLPLLFIGFASGLGYFLYLRFFTHEKDDAPLWATLITIFFFIVLLLVPFGLYSQNKQNKNALKTTFFDLESAKLNPDLVKDLNLKGKNLVTFPLEILTFKNIELLDLSNNQISEIPDELRRMKNLVGLNMSGNPIADKERLRLRKLFVEIEIIF